MSIDGLLMVEPDELDFASLEPSVLAELVMAREFDNPRWAISALGELSRRGYRDESAKRLAIDLATRTVHADEVWDWEHLRAHALSVLYWDAQGPAIAAITAMAKTCSLVVLEDIVDVLMPDLTPQFAEPEFRAAAAAVAQRLEASGATRVEDHEYLELYRTLAG